ncbi:VOC family protein [Palleronia sp. KMU-117]|uniref:VOC family protein n=1 Tax=Palleronia sp. KMU-117 TaxID=3434108 RepID=UPI003D71A54A
MQLGAFSISLSVRDIKRSRAFYETLGFTPVGGDEAQNWLILRNGHATIGLFTGMFEGNLLTFNPGWSPEAAPLSDFDDVREIEARLKTAGISIISDAEAGDGPAHFVIEDPDGNRILVDQHVPRPSRR